MMIEIIIPVYNDSRVFKILESILTNDEKRHTVISIYEGCTEADYITKLKSALRPDDRLFVENDSGIFNAFNKGLKNSICDVLVMMGADDCFSHGFSFEKVLDTFDRLKADLVIASVIYKRNGQATRSITYKRYRSQDFLKGVPFYHVGTFMSKDMAQKYSFDERYSTCADYKFFLEIFSEERNVEIVDGDIVIEVGGASGGWRIRIIALKHMVNILGIGRLIRHPFHFIVRYLYKIKSLK